MFRSLDRWNLTVLCYDCNRRYFIGFWPYFNSLPLLVGTVPGFRHWEAPLKKDVCSSCSREWAIAPFCSLLRPPPTSDRNMHFILSDDFNHLDGALSSCAVSHFRRWAGKWDVDTMCPFLTHLQFNQVCFNALQAAGSFPLLVWLLLRLKVTTAAWRSEVHRVPELGETFDCITSWLNMRKLEHKARKLQSFM